MLPVETILKELNIQYDLIHLGEAAFTVGDVQRLGGEKLGDSVTVKTLILKGKQTRNYYPVVVRGTDRLDMTKVKVVFGEGVSMAKADEVLQLAQVEPGAVCPFLIRQKIYIDAEVMKLNKINLGSGDHLYGLATIASELAKLPHQIVSIA